MTQIIATYQLLEEHNQQLDTPGQAHIGQDEVLDQVVEREAKRRFNKNIKVRRKAQLPLQHSQNDTPTEALKYIKREYDGKMRHLDSGGTIPLYVEIPDEKQLQELNKAIRNVRRGKLYRNAKV